ncbi:MAG: hypothetical protein IKZ07_04060 [Akkermansia sp.]|nr:hypothetical protein [Akkermansia sp.]
MKNHIWIYALAAILPGMVQAAIPPAVDHAFSEYTELPTELLPILASVTDRDSADEAAEKLNAMLPRVYDTRSSIARIQTLSPSVKQELLQKYEVKMRENWGSVYEHIFRLQKYRCYNSLAFFKQFHALCMMLDK